MGYIKQFITEKGGKYTYNEERIESLCVVFNVFGESVQEKTQALVGYAKINPQDFLVRAKATEQTMNIEVSHGLKLKVIEIAGNSVVYPSINGEPPAKIKTFTGKVAEDKMPGKLADYFGTTDGNEAYLLFKAKLDAAKAAIVNQQ